MSISTDTLEAVRLLGDEAVRRDETMFKARRNVAAANLLREAAEVFQHESIHDAFQIDRRGNEGSALHVAFGPLKEIRFVVAYNPRTGEFNSMRTNSSGAPMSEHRPIPLGFNVINDSFEEAAPLESDTAPGKQPVRKSGVLTMVRSLLNHAREELPLST